MKQKLLKTLIVIAYLFPFSISAQIPNWTWAHGNGGAITDEGIAIATDNSGNSIAVGNFQSPSVTFGSYTLTNNGTGTIPDLFVVKRNSQGIVLWAKSAGSTGYDFGKSVAVDASGNVYVTGNFQSPTIQFGSTTLTNAGAEDIYLAKYNASGTVQWAIRLGSTGSDIGTDVAVDNAGNIMITGYYVGTVMFGSTSLTSAGGGDVYIAKYDPSGNAIWAKSAGGTSGDQGLSITTDKNNDVYVTGTFYSASITFPAATINNTAAASYDIFTAKYSSTGTFVWAKGAGSSVSDVAYSVATDNNNNVYVSGYAGINFNFGSNVIPGAPDNLIILKYNTSGVEQWGQSIGGSGNEAGYSIDIDEKDNVYIVGNFGSLTLTFGSTTLTNASAGRDAMILKYDDLGNPLGAKRMGGTTQDYAFGVALDKASNIYVTGYTQSSPSSFDNITITPTGYDVFTAKISSLVAPEICMITVDEQSTNNIIYWDKSNLMGVDSFIVYRETTNNVYNKIGTVSNDSFAVFVDTVRHLYFPNTGNPNTATYKYKIQAKTVLGDTSAMSLWHKTIFVSQNAGLFTFNDYGIEGQANPVPQLNQYLLKRDDSGSGVWATISAATSSPINDPNYASYPNGKWRVETDWTISCDSTRGSINKARSNIKNVALSSGINEETTNKIIIYPNPAENYFTVTVSEMNKNFTIYLYNALGQEVYSKNVIESKSQSIVINTSGFAKGIYSVCLKTKEGNTFNKVIIK